MSKERDVPLIILDSYKHDLRGSRRGVSYHFHVYKTMTGSKKFHTLHQDDLTILGIKRHPNITAVKKYIATTEGAQAVYNNYLLETARRADVAKLRKEMNRGGHHAC